MDNLPATDVGKRLVEALIGVRVEGDGLVAVPLDDVFFRGYIFYLQQWENRILLCEPVFDDYGPFSDSI